MASYVELSPAKNGKPRIKITVELGYHEDTGKRIRKFKTVTLNSLSDRTVSKAIKDFEIEVATTNSTYDEKTITFEQFVDRWFENYVRVDLTVGTRSTYTYYLKSGVFETFQKMKLHKIKTFHIVEFFNKQKLDGKRGLNGKYMVLKSIFSKAVKWGFIIENPMKNVDEPKDKTRNRKLKFYDELQIKQLLSTLENTDMKFKVSVKLALLVGLRMAEIAGIRIECLNFEENTILIDKTLQFDRDTKMYFLGPTKNKKDRIVNVPVKFMEELKYFAEQQEKIKNAHGSAWNPLVTNEGKTINLLITRSDGFPNYPHNMEQRWRNFIKRYDLPPLNFHGLRHSWASYMISKNVNFKIIQEQLGHSSIQETLNTYSHLTQKDKSKASDLLDDII